MDILKTIAIGISLFIVGCSTTNNKVHDIKNTKEIKTINITTKNKENACKILKENNDWLIAAQASYKKWGTPISIQLSFVYHESSFVHDARPFKKDNRYPFGKRYLSTALGFSQALDGTWGDYLKETTIKKPDRKNFGHSVDFIGWYNSKSFKSLKIKHNDAYNLYLAYHEGRGGWKKGYHLKQKWLMNYARSVQKKAELYSKQINGCNLRLK